MRCFLDLASADNGAKRRKIKNYLLYPDVQAKYAMLYSGLIILLGVFVIGIQFLTNRQILSHIENVEVYDTVAYQLTKTLLLQIISFIITAVVLFFLTILTTHRFLGPIVAVIRYFEAIRINGASKPVKLREEDELEPLITYLKSVDFKVFPKDGPLESPANNSKGMTILEVLVSSFILGILLLGFAGSMSTVNKGMKKVQIQGTRGDLAHVIRTNLRSYASLSNSAENNPELYKCLNGNVAGGCESFKEHELNFYASVKDRPVIDQTTGLQMQSPDGSGITAPVMLGGGSGLSCPSNGSQALAPVFYAENGRLCSCDEPAASCPFQLVTSYAAICASGATCERPAAVKLLYKIQLRSDLPEGIAKNTVLKEEESSQIFDLNVDDQYYVKFVNARSYDINLITGVKTVNQALTEVDIRQGKSLSFGVPTNLEFEVNFTSPEDVSSLQLYKYVYPTSCTLNKVGASDCMLPQESDFVALPVVAFAATKKATVTITNSVTAGTLIDYRLRTFNAAGTVMNTSTINLRAYFRDSGTLTVTPPPSLVFVCDPASTVNTFAFQAKAAAGWKTLTHTISPGLSYGGATYNSIPGVVIDKTKTTEQKFVVDSKYFSPGVAYTITFTGETGDGFIRNDARTFTSLAKPASLLTITSPAAASNVRTKNDLNIGMDVNLGCGDSISTLKLDIKKNANNTSIFPATDIASSCVSVPGAADENKFRCTKIMPCTEWLVAADVAACEAKFSVDTQLKATAVVTSSNAFTQKKSVDFIAGSKISVNILPNFVQWVVNNASGLPSLNTTSIPTQVLLSSALSVGESINLKMDGSVIHSVHTCAYSGSSNASYNTSNRICTLSMTTPSPVKGDVVALTSPDSNVEIISPSNVVLWELNESQMSCENIIDKPVCSGGKSLVRKITTMGAYNLTYGDGKYSYSSYMTQKDDSAVDFFVSYIPKSPSALGNFAITLEKVVAVGANGAVDSFKSKFAMSTGALCSTTGGCPGSLVQADGSQFSARRANFPGGQPFDITFTNSFPANMTPELVVVRECYCGP